MRFGWSGALALAALCVGFHTAGAQSAAGGVASYDWKPLRIGAGGWLTGLDVSADGATMVVRTDTYGAYVWDFSSWRQVVTASSMPAAEVNTDAPAGVYEIRVAPNNPTRLYMSYRGYIYRSDTRGFTWVRTVFGPAPMDPNDDFRTFGEKMAVDPANANVVYAGTPQNGLFRTLNAGASWQRITSVPAGQGTPSGFPGITGIVFDRNSGTVGGRTRTAYASSYGNGVWVTTDGGATWGRIPGGPSSVRHADVAADRVFYATSGDPGANAVWRFAGVWQNITPPGGMIWHAVATDPFTVNRVVLGSDGGFLNQSFTRGDNWNGVIWTVTRVAPDIPWLAWTNEIYMSNGGMRFDPVTPTRLWFSEGIGVWRTLVPASPPSITWTSQSLGIEQLVANSIAAPPGGKPVVGSWDRPLFYVDNPDVFPSQHQPDNVNAIVMGWAVDYASTDPSFLAAIVNWWGLQKSGYSTNGGQTWTPFPTFPAWPEPPIGGTIAASTSDNIVWVGSNRTAPYFTQNRGQTWLKVSLPGVPDTPAGWDGIHWAYFLNRHIVAADRVTAGTFYMYHTPNGLYRSTDGGNSWGLVHPGEIVAFSGFNATLKSVPGHAGHLFFSAGHSSGAVPFGEFKQSTDGGVTWVPVPNVLEVHSFGFGKQAVESAYPAIFIAGWVGGVYGIWRSDDQGQSWTHIGDFPVGSLDQVTTVDGDKDVYGVVYVGFRGSGYAYGAPRPDVATDFHTIVPCRLIDTRLAVHAPALGASTQRPFSIAGRCGIPATARAVSVNLAVTGATAAGNLQLSPAGTPLSAVSAINYSAGKTRSNNAIAGLGEGGRIVVRCVQAAGTTHFILDVNGYFE